jgi:hypothetical protein
MQHKTVGVGIAEAGISNQDANNFVRGEARLTRDGDCFYGAYARVASNHDERAGMFPRETSLQRLSAVGKRSRERVLARYWNAVDRL